MRIGTRLKEPESLISRHSIVEEPLLHKRLARNGILCTQMCEVQTLLHDVEDGIQYRETGTNGSNDDVQKGTQS